MKTKNIFGLFLITFLALGFLQSPSFADDTSNDNNDVVTRSDENQSMILYLRSFSLAEGKSARVRAYYEEESSQGYTENVHSSLAGRIPVWSRTEIQGENTYTMVGEWILDFNNAKDDLVEFTWVEADNIRRLPENNNWQPDYVSQGLTLFRFRPDKVIRTKDGKPFMELGQDDVLDIRWAMPVWEVGKNAPVRLMFGPKFSTGLVQHDMSPLQGLRDAYPNKTLKYTTSFGGSVSAGANVLLFLGRDPNTAWQLGASAEISEERSFHSGTDKHRIAGNKYSVFLYSPEYYMATSDTSKRYPMQFYLQWKQDNMDIDTYTGEGATGTELEYLELPEFDYENQSVEWGMILRY